MTIIYEFPIDQFHTSDSFATLSVAEGFCILNEPPGEALQALIEKYDGVIVPQLPPASRAAQTLATQYKIDISDIEGSGTNGRVLLKDIYAFVQQ